jgi:nucleoid DNA-binding protein/cell division septation protein DedD
MINLGHCIVFLLSRQDRVVVNRFGHFSRLDTPGYFDKETNQFFASTYTVKFSPDTNIQDENEVLTNYVAAQRLISKNEAKALVDNAIQSLLTTLNKAGIVELVGFGIMKKDSDSIHFSLADGHAFLGQARSVLEVKKKTDGLPVAPLRTDETAVSEVQTVSDEQIVNTEEGIKEEQFVGTEEEVEEYAIRKNSFWKNAGIFVFFVATALLSLYFFRPDLFQKGQDFFTQQIEKNFKKTPAPIKQVAPVVVNDTIPQIDAADLALLDSIAPIDSVRTEVLAENLPTVTYEIIVGSFTSMELADKFVGEMKAKGIEVWAIDSRMPGNRKKVSCGSYATEAEAYRALGEIKRTVEPGAWVARVDRSKLETAQ